MSMSPKQFPFTNSKDYEAPHYAIFSNLLLFPLT
jgi:hypothetical protein